MQHAQSYQSINTASYEQEQYYSDAIDSLRDQITQALGANESIYNLDRRDVDDYMDSDECINAMSELFWAVYMSGENGTVIISEQVKTVINKAMSDQIESLAKKVHEERK